MGIGVRTRRFSVEDYHQMVRAGILREDERVELVEGEIIEVTPIGPRHAVSVAGLTEHFVRSLATRAVVWVQSPIRLGPPGGQSRRDLVRVRKLEIWTVP
jgi:hypothetical protein